MDATTWARKGAPVGHAVVSDAAALLYYYVGVPKNAAHPNAATLFILESMTREEFCGRVVQVAGAALRP